MFCTLDTYYEHPNAEKLDQMPECYLGNRPHASDTNATPGTAHEEAKRGFHTGL
jgi:hypothetical protein